VCHVRCRIGDVGLDGRVRDDGRPMSRGVVGHSTRTRICRRSGQTSANPSSARASASSRLRANRAGLLARLRRFPWQPGWIYLPQVVLASYVGPSPGQEALDMVVTATDLP